MKDEIDRKKVVEKRKITDIPRVICCGNGGSNVFVCNSKHAAKKS